MVKPANVAVVLLAVPALVLVACSPNQNATETPGATPSVWTGSTSPGATSPTGSPTETPGRGEQTLTAQLASADRTQVATATLVFTGDFATITVEAAPNKVLQAGFHGLHIHKVGKCEPNSVSPTDGKTGDFLSAGGHFQAPGHDGHPASGDLTSLQVRDDGSAKLVTTTDTVTAEELLADAGTAIIIHEKADNFANIPDRYTVNGTAGPDAETLATGDAGKRMACGKIVTG